MKYSTDLMKDIVRLNIGKLSSVKLMKNSDLKSCIADSINIFRS